jgi:hypothetical protein
MFVMLSQIYLAKAFPGPRFAPWVGRAIIATDSNVDYARIRKCLRNLWNKLTLNN